MVHARARESYSPWCVSYVQEGELGGLLCYLDPRRGPPGSPFTPMPIQVGSCVGRGFISPPGPELLSVPWAAVVGLRVARRCAVRPQDVWVALPAAGSGERVRVLDRALRLDRVIAAVQRVAA
jgi:hypothetical protein